MLQTESPHLSAKAFRIVLIEDNPGDVYLISAALEEHEVPHTLQVLDDGRKAINFVEGLDNGRSTGPDLFLLDLNLPKVSGFDVLAALRTQSVAAATPVIVVSSSDSDSDRTRAAKLGVNHYFCKPADYDDFLKLGDLVKRICLAG